MVLDFGYCSCYGSTRHLPIDWRRKMPLQNCKTCGQQFAVRCWRCITTTQEEIDADNAYRKQQERWCRILSIEQYQGRINRNNQEIVELEEANRQMFLEIAREEKLIKELENE